MSATRLGTSTTATSSGIIQGDQGAQITAATTITLTDAIHEVTGSATITTINGGKANGLYFLIPATGSTWSLGTGGNIEQGATAEDGIPIAILYDGSSWRLSGGVPAAPVTLFTNTGNHTSSGMVDGMRSPTTLSISDGSSATPSSTAQPQITVSRVTNQNFSDGIGQVVLHGTKAGGTGGLETLSVYARQSAALESGAGLVGIYTRTVATSSGAGQSHFATVDAIQKFVANVDCSATEMNVNNLTAQDSSPSYSSAGDRCVVLGLVSDGSARNTAGLYISGANATGGFFTGLDLGPYACGLGQFVDSVTITAAGSGYTGGATVAFSGGGGSTQATGTVTVVGGEVTAVNLVTRGTGYTSAPTVTISPVGAGSGATATAVMRSYAAIRSRVAAPSLETANNQWIQWRPASGTGANLDVLRALTDGNTVLNTIAGGVIGFYVGNSQKMIMSSGGALGVGVTSGTPATTLDVNGAVSTRRTDITLADGANSNVNIGTGSYLKASGPTGAYNITGFTGGVNGRHIWIHLANTGTCTFTHQATSTAANQITTFTGADVAMAAGQGSAHLIYDSATSKWILMSVDGY